MQYVRIGDTLLNLAHARKIVASPESSSVCIWWETGDCEEFDGKTGMILSVWLTSRDSHYSIEDITRILD